MSDELDRLIREIIELSGLNKDEILKRIGEKQVELYGFVTLEGCARMVKEEIVGG